MQRMPGLLHETTFDSTREQQQTHHASSSVPPQAGQKRSRSINDAVPSRHAPANSHGTMAFQRASSLQPEPTRLAPSIIVDLTEDKSQSEYSQRRAIAATPTTVLDPELTLAHPTYQLPRLLVHNLASLGIKEMYPWQKTCLKGPGLLSGSRNLVYCAPTGGGKSLVADGQKPALPQMVDLADPL
jgi:DNA polymerase theta